MSILNTRCSNSPLSERVVCILNYQCSLCQSSYPDFIVVWRIIRQAQHQRSERQGIYSYLYLVSRKPINYLRPRPLFMSLCQGEAWTFGTQDQAHLCWFWDTPPGNWWRSMDQLFFFFTAEDPSLNLASSIKTRRCPEQMIHLVTGSIQGHLNSVVKIWVKKRK